MNVVEVLQRDGCSLIPSMRGNEIYEINNFLMRKQVYNAHVRAKSSKHMSVPEAFGQPDWPMFCHDMEDAVLAPHFFEHALYTFDIAKQYFDGEFPLLYSMNAFWTQFSPAGVTYGDTHGWHRDGDGRRQLVVFMYGRDVLTDDAGSHKYQRGTHKKPDDYALGYPFTGPPDDVVETFIGNAGTMFMVDTNGLHMGLRPKTGKRLLMWARWGTDDPPVSYRWDELKPVSKALLGDRYDSLIPELQQAVHLVAA